MYHLYLIGVIKTAAFQRKIKRRIARVRHLITQINSFFPPHKSHSPHLGGKETRSAAEIAYTPGVHMELN